MSIRRAALAVFAFVAFAQTYRLKADHFIVPYPAGGGSEPLQSTPQEFSE